MTIEDAKEMIKLVATDEGLIDVESVMKIIDRIDVKVSQLWTDTGTFKIHPEDGHFYGNGPRDCYGNPIPYCSSADYTKTSYDPNKYCVTTTCNCCDE